MISRLAVISMHTSPRLQPGVGNAGGMNVYIDELSQVMAEHGIHVVVFTRACQAGVPIDAEVSPLYTVVRIEAGPMKPIPMADMVQHVDEFGDGVERWIDESGLTFDLIHSHYWLSGRTGVRLKNRLGIPLANSFHTLGRVKDVNRRDDEPAASEIRKGIEFNTIAQSDCVVASTPYEFDDLLDHYGATPERLCISPPGIDHTLFSPGSRDEARQALGWGNEPTLLCVGRIQALKGFDIAVAATAEVAHRGIDDLRLVIVGGPSGPAGDSELAMLQTLATDLGIADRVTFTGPESHERLPAYYRGADLLLMPSRSESFGLVAAEAQACGLPVIASSVGGLPYVVADGESGILIDGHSPSAFAAAIDKTLSSPDDHARMQLQAIANADKFSWEKTVDRLLELYDGIKAL
ncbi:D-inositol-3-phosphate glycosyltransferase [hydrothermal vent metagenome]|uniref:D-inositol-3-phosphate glycosyltransferase n=1 Tax=hydrothermal vent metagenome TaxID=652676 RepID=A0A3B0TL10_9ZZZZ